MDSFGDNFVENDVDPAADFLAREQNDLAGLADELSAPAPQSNGIIGKESDVLNLDGNDAKSDQELNSLDSNKDSGAVMNHRVPKEEAEKIKKWREEQAKLLEEKDKLEEKKKDEWRLAAKKELEEWYKHHEDLVTKTRASNRNAEKQFVAEEGEIEPGTEWERIAKLCDFNKKSSHISKDISRMRTIILQLKQSPPNSAKQA